MPGEKRGVLGDATGGDPYAQLQVETFQLVGQPIYPVRKPVVGDPMPDDITVFPAMVYLHRVDAICTELPGHHSGVREDEFLCHGQARTVPRQPAH